MLESDLASMLGDSMVDMMVRKLGDLMVDMTVTMLVRLLVSPKVPH